MKKLIVALILILTIQVFGQDYTANSMSSKNTSTTVLDSVATFTGTAELLRGYNSVSVTVRADQSGTYKILFGNTSTITTANAVKTYSFSYTANDTLHTKSVPADAPYMKVVFTNSGDTQTKFYLITMLNKGQTIAIDEFGSPLVSISRVSTTGYGTHFFGKQDTVITTTDTTTVPFILWCEGEIKANDSCEVSIDGAFTTGYTFIITETTAVTIPKWAILSSNKLYIRRYGGAGTVTFYLRLFGY